MSTKETIRTTCYLHNDKRMMYAKGVELGLTGKALENFAYALYEVTIPIVVNPVDGSYVILTDEVKG